MQRARLLAAPVNYGDQRGRWYGGAVVADRVPALVTMRTAGMAAGKSWWQAGLTPRQCFITGSMYFVVGTIELLLLAVVGGGHVVNWVAAIGSVVAAIVSFASGLVRLRRTRPGGPAASDGNHW